MRIDMRGLEALVIAICVTIVAILLCGCSKTVHLGKLGGHLGPVSIGLDFDAFIDTGCTGEEGESIEDMIEEAVPAVKSVHWLTKLLSVATGVKVGAGGLAGLVLAWIGSKFKRKGDKK